MTRSPADGRAETIARLTLRIAELQAQLSQSQADLAAANRELGMSRSPELVEVNEKLLLAALNADHVADAARIDLKELAWSSQFDALTNTPNRILMLDRIKVLIASSRRTTTRFAVFFVDIDHFKKINDTLGHAAGDKALQLVVARLQSGIRDTDTVCRYGGDEFVLVLPSVTDRADAQRIVDKLLTVFAPPALVDGHSLALSVSIGMAMYPEDGTDPATLITKADRAMYRRRRQVRGN